MYMMKIKPTDQHRKVLLSSLQKNEKTELISLMIAALVHQYNRFTDMLSGIRHSDDVNLFMLDTSNNIKDISHGIK